MAGYIGSKAVNLSTTGADIAGDADVSGALDVGGNVDIAGTLTSDGLTVNDTLRLDNEDTTVSTGGTFGDIEFYDNDGGSASAGVTAKIEAQAASPYGASSLIFYTSSSSTGARSALTQQMQIDAGGNLLVAHTGSVYNNVNATSTEGISLTENGEIFACSSQSSGVMILNRKSTDGTILTFDKDGSSVGVIGVAGADFTISGVGTTSGIYFNANGLIPLLGGNLSDNTEDIGQPNFRWNDAYITNGVTTGSDGNDKQDIRDLTEAEQRVAVACKGLFKAWRWKSAVEEKGDAARTHFGIIAQDLQAAFAAEGLDAGRYAMFMSNTWWETQTEVPAVEAVAEVTETTTDEDGNEVVTVVTEAVEAVDAYTRTDTYDTQEEAPEGATERTRLGVRYSELLAFIIGAL